MVHLAVLAGEDGLALLLVDGLAVVVLVGGLELVFRDRDQLPDLVVFALYVNCVSNVVLRGLHLPVSALRHS